MDFNVDVERNWLDELEQFISRWEMETKSIKDKSLDAEECDHISALFHKDSDGLLVKRPVGISDEEIVKRLEKLDGKLGSVLAMACTSELKTVKKL
jgi:hypothetical protein